MTARVLPAPVFVCYLQRGKWHIIWSEVGEAVPPERDLTRCSQWPRLSSTWPPLPSPDVVRWDYRTTEPVASSGLCRLCARSWNSAYRPHGYALDLSGQLTEVIPVATKTPTTTPPTTTPPMPPTAVPLAPATTPQRDASLSRFGTLPAHVPLDMPTEGGAYGRRRRTEYWIERFTQRIEHLQRSLQAFPDDLLITAEHDALASVLGDLRQELSLMPTLTDWAFVAGLYVTVGLRNDTTLRIDLSFQGQDDVLQWLASRFGGVVTEGVWVLEGATQVEEFLESAMAQVPVSSGAPINHVTMSGAWPDEQDEQHQQDEQDEQEEPRGPWDDVDDDAL